MLFKASRSINAKPTQVLRFIQSRVYAFSSMSSSFGAHAAASTLVFVRQSMARSCAPTYCVIERLSCQMSSGLAVRRCAAHPASVVAVYNIPPSRLVPGQITASRVSRSTQAILPNPPSPVCMSSIRLDARLPFRALASHCSKPSSPPPIPDAPLQLRPRNPIANQAHRHPQAFRIPIPRLVVKEQEILKRNPCVLMQLLHMRDLTPRVDLEPAVKHVQRTSRLLRFL